MQQLCKIILIILLVLFMNMPVCSEDLDLFSGPDQGIINGVSVNLRKGPDLKEKVVCIITEKNAPVHVLVKQVDWFKVKTEDCEGWIQEAYISLVQEFSEISEEAALQPEDEAMPITSEETVALLEDEEAFEVTQETMEFPEDEEDTETVGVFVKEIVFEGNTVISSGTLSKATEQFTNKALTLEEMGGLTDVVTMTYQEQGYILARAYLPEQEIADGVLKVSIAEGRIGKIVVTGGKHYNEDVIKRYFKKQEKHGVIKESLLEKGILLANEIPKVKTDVVLREGEKPGEVDVVLNTKESTALSFTIDGSFDFNNYGSEEVSKERYGTSVNLIDHNWGTTLRLRGIIGNTYDDSALGNVNFSIPINSYGTKLSFNYLKGNYVIGRGLSELGLGGRTRNYGATITHPLYKDKNANFNISLAYEHKYTETEVLKQITNIDEIDIGSMSLDFDNLDRFLGKNIVSFAYYFGDVEEDDTIIPFRTDFRKRFDLVSLHVARIQKLYGYTNFMLKANGQISDDRLLPMEQMIIGGYNSVRGHEPSIFLGDSGYNVTSELMFAPPFIADKNLFGLRIAQMVQFAIFYDYAGVFVSDYTEQDVNRNEYISGYGCGLRLFYKDLFNLRYDLGFPTKRLDDKPKLFNYFQCSFSFF